MVRNPLRSRAERKTGAMLTRVGWEPPQTWAVTQPGDVQLAFPTRLPAAEFIAVEELPARDRRAPASVGGEIVALEQAAESEHVFLAAAICSTISFSLNTCQSCPPRRPKVIFASNDGFAFFKNSLSRSTALLRK